MFGFEKLVRYYLPGFAAALAALQSTPEKPN
jgi:hypothetical protein